MIVIAFMQGSNNNRCDNYFPTLEAPRQAILPDLRRISLRDFPSKIRLVKMCQTFLFTPNNYRSSVFGFIDFFVVVPFNFAFAHKILTIGYARVVYYCCVRYHLRASTPQIHWLLPTIHRVVLRWFLLAAHIALRLLSRSDRNESLAG